MFLSGVVAFKNRSDTEAFVKINLLLRFRDIINLIEDEVVKAKAPSEEEITTEFLIKYKMYAGSEIIKRFVLESETNTDHSQELNLGISQEESSE